MSKEVKWKGFSKDIIVLDNVVPQEMADKFETIVTDGYFPWYLIRDIHAHKLTDESNYRIVYDENTVNTIQLGHDVFNKENVDKEINSSIYNEVSVICDHCCEQFDIRPQYLSQRLNMLGQNLSIKEGKYNTPHIDSRFSDSYSMLYYVNDSDGDTIIFNETIDEKNKKRPEKLTIKKTITPKKNRAVLFIGNYFHTSTNPTNNDKRIVLNVNLINLNEFEVTTQENINV